MSGSIVLLAIAAGFALTITMILWVRPWRRSDVGDDPYPEVSDWSILRPSRDSKSGISTVGIIAMSGLFSSSSSSGSGGDGGSSCGDGGASCS